MIPVVAAEMWDRLYGYVMGSPPIVQAHIERSIPQARAYSCNACSTSGAVPVNTEQPRCWNCGGIVKPIGCTTGDFVKGAIFEDFLEA